MCLQLFHAARGDAFPYYQWIRVLERYLLDVAHDDDFQSGVNIYAVWIHLEACWVAADIWLAEARCFIKRWTSSIYVNDTIQFVTFSFIDADGALFCRDTFHDNMLPQFHLHLLKVEVLSRPALQQSTSMEYLRVTIHRTYLPPYTFLRHIGNVLYFRGHSWLLKVYMEFANKYANFDCDY
jgi:hypothetical protein